MNNFTVHALRDFFLGGYQAIVRNNEKEIYRSIRPFPNRTMALRHARYWLKYRLS